MHFLNTFVSFSHEMATNDIRTFAFYPYLWTFRNWVLKMTPNESVLIPVTAVSGFSKPGSSYNIDNILKGQVKISGVITKIFFNSCNIRSGMMRTSSRGTWTSGAQAPTSSPCPLQLPRCSGRTPRPGRRMTRSLRRRAPSRSCSAPRKVPGRVTLMWSAWLTVWAAGELTVKISLIKAKIF